MRDIDNISIEKLRETTTNFSLCWRIIRTDLNEFCFTDADHDIVIRNKTYSASGTMNPSAIQESSNFIIDNFDIDGILNSDLIKIEEILEGRFDNSKVEIFLVDLSEKDEYDQYFRTVFLKSGKIGTIKTIGNGKFVAEINGFLETAKQNITERYSLTCRANFGDKRCKINLNNYLYSGIITEVIDDKSFIDINNNKENGYFDYGMIIIMDQNNKQIEANIKFFIDKRFELCKTTPIKLKEGMNYIATPGCDKSTLSCSKKFHNIINFRGEPHIAGIEKLYNKKQAT